MTLSPALAVSVSLTPSLNQTLKATLRLAESNYSGIQIWVQVRGRSVEVQLWNLQPCCLPRTNLFLVTD